MVSMKGYLSSSDRTLELRNTKEVENHCTIIYYTTCFTQSLHQLFVSTAKLTVVETRIPL